MCEDCENDTTTLVNNANIVDEVTSKKITIPDNVVWSLQVIKKGADGLPNCTVECSNDDRTDITESTRKWVKYSTATTAVDIGVTATDDSIMIFDAIFAMKYIRIKIAKNDCTTGTVTALLLLK